MGILNIDILIVNLIKVKKKGEANRPCYQQKREIYEKWCFTDNTLTVT